MPVRDYRWRRQPGVSVGTARLLVLTTIALCVSCTGGPVDVGPVAEQAGPRFHHAHLRVADPAAEMDRYARANGCEKLILRGLGVGVRCADAYLLFDRNDTPVERAATPARVTVTGVGADARVAVEMASDDPEAAAAWLADAIDTSASATVTFADGADSGFDAMLTHVGFGARDQAPVLARLEASDAVFLSQTAESAVVSGPGGVVLELIRHLGNGPEQFWCPMHPDVRSPGEGTCPLCGMALVPIPPPVFGSYALDVDFTASGPHRGRLTLRAREPGTGRVATSFATIHERLLHLFIVSRQLDVFQHVHPELQPDGSFVLDVDVPRADAYTLITDFYPSGGTPQMLQAAWVTPDYRGSPFPDASAIVPDVSPKSVGTIRARLETDALAAGRDATLTFTVTDARRGTPVTDLQSYLGAPAHLLILSTDLADVVHSHPSDIESTGPTVEFDAVFPRPGRYKMWVQFQRDDEVVTAPFVVDVS